MNKYHYIIILIIIVVSIFLLAIHSSFFNKSLWGKIDLDNDPHIIRSICDGAIDRHKETKITITKICTLIIKDKNLPQNEDAVNILIIMDPNLRERLFRIFLAFIIDRKPIITDKGICYFDAWWNPLRYKYLGKNAKGEESFMVYSYGPNGIDENGKGDDIAETNSISIKNKPK